MKQSPITIYHYYFALISRDNACGWHIYISGLFKTYYIGQIAQHNNMRLGAATVANVSPYYVRVNLEPKVGKPVDGQWDSLKWGDDIWNRAHIVAFIELYCFDLSSFFSDRRIYFIRLLVQ